MTLLLGLAFAACCLAQIWLIQRLESALKARHQQAYEQIYGLFAMSRLVRFAVSRRDRAMQDPELTTRAKQLRLLTFVAIGLWVTLAVMFLTGHR